MSIWHWGLAGLAGAAGIFIGGLYCLATWMAWRAAMRHPDTLSIILVCITLVIFGVAGGAGWLIIMPLASLPSLGLWLAGGSLLLNALLLWPLPGLMHAIAAP